MSELRQDPFTDRWVVIARNRASRPQEFADAGVRHQAVTCPFCVGNESETPTELARYPSAETSGDWQVRVVPNKYPAFQFPPAAPTGPVESAAASAASAAAAYLADRRQEAAGAHEVIIESPAHLVSFSQLTARQAELSFLAYRDRMQALSAIPEIAYALIFKNSGHAAGASLEHVHSQLVGLPWIPAEVQYELTKAAEHKALRGATIMQSVLDAEASAGQRIVEETDDFVVFCPAASRFPYETWVVPRQPAPGFQWETPEHVGRAACLVQQVIHRLERVVERPAYNFWLHSAPLNDDSGRIHWRVEIAPRLAGVAGFEIGSGCFINPVAPEDAASRLTAAESTGPAVPDRQDVGVRKTR